MVPELPIPPSFPQLKWELVGDGYYGITEEDADKLLNFAEYQLPLFYWQLSQYENQVKVVLEGLTTF